VDGVERGPPGERAAADAGARGEECAALSARQLAAYTDADAGDWWRQVAQVGDIVPEVYFNAPRSRGKA
jgi:hypothetical protein